MEVIMINTILDIIRLLNDGNIVPMQKDEDTKIDLYNEKVQLFMDASGEESKYYYFSELEINDENQDNLAEIEDVALNSDAYTVIEKPTPSDSYMILFWKVECIEERMYPDIIKIEENEFFYKKYVFYYTLKDASSIDLINISFSISTFCFCFRIPSIFCFTISSKSFMTAFGKIGLKNGTLLNKRVKN